jgi:hypothetical protein
MQKLKQNDIVLLELPVRKIENLRTKNQGNGGNLLHNTSRELRSIIGLCTRNSNLSHVLVPANYKQILKPLKPQM